MNVARVKPARANRDAAMTRSKDDPATFHASPPADSGNGGGECVAVPPAGCTTRQRKDTAGTAAQR